MMVTFTDCEDDANPDNGARIEDGDALGQILSRLVDREPFVLLLEGEDGQDLTIGFGGPVGWVQLTDVDGAFWTAVLPGAPPRDGFVEFMCGGTPTPISERFCMPIENVERIARHFVKTGRRLSDVEWEPM